MNNKILVLEAYSVVAGVDGLQHQSGELPRLEVDVTSFLLC